MTAHKFAPLGPILIVALLTAYAVSGPASATTIAFTNFRAAQLHNAAAITMYAMRNGGVPLMDEPLKRLRYSAYRIGGGNLAWVPRWQ